MRNLTCVSSYEYEEKIIVNRGFSLVEVMVVIAVIAILASFAFPVYQNYAGSTEINRCYSFLNTTRLVADNLIQLNNGEADGITASALGIDGSNDCDQGIVVADTTTTGNMTLRGSSKVPGQANTVILSLIRSGANGTWSCSSNISSAGITPDVCP